VAVSKIITWIKANKLAAILLLVVGYFVFKNLTPSLLLNRSISAPGVGGEFVGYDSGSSLKINTAETLPYRSGVAPAPEVTDRIVITESSLSLVVKKVNEIQKTIQKKAEELGGYLVNINTSNPSEAAAASGSITVRVPQKKLDEALDYFRGLAAKVVFESINGQDVTDEYVDIETRLNNLGKVKTKYEEILAKAEKVDDIMQVQNQLVNLQSQIDNLKGQQKYLEKSAEFSKVTVYLSTDELALPYAPTETWRPTVIFKKAVRSLVGSVRKIGSLIIWVAVYSIIWIPALVIYKLIQRRRNKTY
jgi:hypothetical protein